MFSGLIESIAHAFLGTKKASRQGGKPWTIQQSFCPAGVKPADDGCKAAFAPSAPARKFPKSSFENRKLPMDQDSQCLLLVLGGSRFLFVLRSRLRS